MGFYEQISKYYDYIFPVGDSQLKFITEASGNAGNRVLDVACGSGGYSVELARSGYKVTAADLDDKMVRLARDKALVNKLEVEVVKCDMLKLSETVTGSFDCVFCIGNSLVHLGSSDQILEALKQMYSLISDGGRLVLQIINYDRIVKYNISELPPIKNDSVGLLFIREYKYIQGKGLISFDTRLTVGKGEGKEEYFNSIELLPLISSDMKELLAKAGFRAIELYGDFNYSAYGEDSFMLVVKAVK